MTYIFLLYSAFLTVVGIWNSRTSADHTPALVRTIIAFIADPNQSARTYVWVTYHTFTIALFAQSTDSCKNKMFLKSKKLIQTTCMHFTSIFILLTYSWLFSAKNQIWMMFCHGFSIKHLYINIRTLYSLAIKQIISHNICWLQFLTNPDKPFQGHMRMESLWKGA